MIIRKKAPRDIRLDAREPPDKYYAKAEEGGWKGSADNPAYSLWGVFARSKYVAAKKGPREPGQRPNDLRTAAELLFASMELCWRSGHKSDDLAADFLEMIRAMK